MGKERELSLPSFSGTCSQSLENGAPISLIQENPGQKSLETTAKETHVRPNGFSGQSLKGECPHLKA